MLEKIFPLLFFFSHLWMATASDNNPLHQEVAKDVIYEIQVRTANACHINAGDLEQQKRCKKKISPNPENYFQKESKCPKELQEELKKIRLGTLDDLLEKTVDFHQGITLSYLHKKVGASVIWLMPVFPNNDEWDLPDACDHLGSPYAVRDYMHVRGSLSKACLQLNQNDHCYGDESLQKLIDEAHSKGIKVMLDLAFNHFGHNYLYYDYQDFESINEYMNNGENPDDYWNYPQTFDKNLLYPEILDSEEKLKKITFKNPQLNNLLNELQNKCPHYKGDQLVRAFNMYREMRPWEKNRFSCDEENYLEKILPGFYLGKGDPHPSSGPGDNFSNNWRDVKFLFHLEKRDLYYEEFVRNREYLFRIMNYWVSKGVDGFRLDHASDEFSKLSVNEWKYIIGKVNYYDYLRKGKPSHHIPPFYLTEEFGDQKETAKISDIMTEGVIGDVRNAIQKDTSHMEKVITGCNRFHSQTYVMNALEDHDEKRLLDTFQNPWQGAGFWGILAANFGVPMILMGQEFGEPWGLGFRRADFLRSRFIGTEQYFSYGDLLRNYYQKMIIARRNDKKNSAFLSDKYYFLRTHQGTIDNRIFAEIRYGFTPHNVLFLFHNLFEVGDIEQHYKIPSHIAKEIGLQDDALYRFYNILEDKQEGICHFGFALKQDLPLFMKESERVRWLRLELCQ